MSRTARSWCPRSSLPPLPLLIEVDDSSTKQPHINTKLKNEPMTWQQEEDFGESSKLGDPQSARPQWKPLALKESSTASVDADNSWLAQQSEFPTSSKQPRRNARGKAAAHRASAVEPAKPVSPTSPHTKDATEEQKPPYKKRSRNSKKKAGHSNMARPLNSTARVYIPPHLRGTARVYTPPHLRNRASADAGKADSAHSSGVAVNTSSAASDQSKAAIASKLDPIPNGAAHQQNSASSSPTVAQEPHQKGQRKSATPEPIVYNGWDEPKAELPVAPKKSGNPRWPRGPQPYKKTVWPKPKDMKYIPSNSDSDGGVDFKSNSNGDPYYDIKKLTDWNGDWLPAPETWAAARKGHVDRHFGAHIEQWINEHPPVYYSPDTFLNDDAKELAPRYWLEAKVGGENLREVWKDLVNPEKEPKPLDENDLTDYLPWWELYEDHTTNYLNALHVPDAKVNFDDPEYPSASWMLASANEKVQEKNKRIAEKHRKMMAKRSRPLTDSKFPVPPMADRRLHPKANIYIRPVQPEDVQGISDIYNYYINSTICAIEFDERTLIQMAQRIQDVVNAGLPYLVAVSKGNESRVAPGRVSEKIAGFINLDDYCDQSSLLRYTFEMQLFVHPGFVSKGIGKCLVDRLLEMADTSYRARGGYEYVNDQEYLKTGPSRVIKTILLNVHHENGEDLDADWRGKFLSACKFVRVGRLPKVGYKHDKVVDFSIFAHQTKEDIDPSARPTVAG